MDVEEIEAVPVRYAPAIDSMDRSLLWTCFTDDTTIDFGGIGSWWGGDDLVTSVEAAHAGTGHPAPPLQPPDRGGRGTGVAPRLRPRRHCPASHPDEGITT